MRIEIPEIDNDAIAEVLNTQPRLVLEAQVETGAAPEGERQFFNSIAAMEATGFTPYFDWIAEFEGNQALLNDAGTVQTADLELLRKLMTAHIRMDRFTEGHLDSLVANGYWAACFQRLQVLHTERGG